MCRQVQRPVQVLLQFWSKSAIAFQPVNWSHLVQNSAELVRTRQNGLELVAAGYTEEIANSLPSCDLVTPVQNWSHLVRTSESLRELVTPNKLAIALYLMRTCEN